MILALICLSPLTESKRIKKHKSHSPKKFTKDTYTSYFFNLFSGFSFEICSGISVDNCFAEEWKDKKPSSEDTKTIDGVFNTESYWQKVEPYLVSTVDMVCKVHSLKYSLTSYVYGQVGWKYRRNKRLFLQGKRKRFNDWGFYNWVAEKTSTIADAATDLVSGVVDVGGAVANWTYEQAKEMIKETITNYFKPVIDIYVNHLKEPLEKFFKSDVFKKLQKTLLCFKSLANGIYKAEKNLTGVINNIITNVNNIYQGDPIMWIEVIISLICKAQSFKALIKVLFDAVKFTGKERWHSVGLFIGKFFLLIGGFKLYTKFELVHTKFIR